MPDVSVEGWRGPWRDDDPDAAFKERVARSALLDPLSTLTELSATVGVPVGGLVHHVLVEWASAGSAGLVELGPTEVARLLAIVEGDGSDAEKLAALRGRLRWLMSGVE